ncbi:MAG: hypothetical protein ACI4EA_03345 [Candidatus Ornithomonoglobus sp.]
MTKQYIKIGIIAVLALIIIGEAGYIYKNNAGVYSDTAGTEAPEQALRVSVSTDIAKINNEAVPVYTIEGNTGTFFTDIDLGLFGFTCSLSEDKYILSCEDGVRTLTSEDFAVIPEETVAYSSDKLLYVEETSYTCYKTDEAVLVPSAAVAAMGGDVMKSDSTKTTYYAFGTDEEIDKQREISTNEIRMYDGAYITTDTEKDNASESVSNTEAAQTEEKKEDTTNE